jgi:acetate kinase
MDSVLAVNVGSSSVKWSLVAEPDEHLADSGELAYDPRSAGVDLSHLVERLPPASAIGHRFVHGGARFRQSTRIDPSVRAALEELSPLDPLHTPAALRVLDAIQTSRESVPEVAVFDTAFHATIPEEAALYPVPLAWSERLGVRRFGFHGLSVAWSVERAARMLGRVPPRLVVCHLGSGCSLTAVRDGRSIDTTMGFTPLEGTMMGTRSGSVDPGMILYLLRRGEVDVDGLASSLERASGLFGISGHSDLREVLERADRGDARADLAYRMFVHSVRRHLGAMLGVLGGADAVVFTGGIGEHSARTRADILSPFEWAGLAIAQDAGSGDRDIARGPIRILVVHAREDLVLAREVRRVLNGS